MSEQPYNPNEVNNLLAELAGQAGGHPPPAGMIQQPPMQAPQAQQMQAPQAPQYPPQGYAIPQAPPGYAPPIPPTVPHPMAPQGYAQPTMQAPQYPPQYPPQQAGPVNLPPGMAEQLPPVNPPAEAAPAKRGRKSKADPSSVQLPGSNVVQIAGKSFAVTLHFEALD